MIVVIAVPALLVALMFWVAVVKSKRLGRIANGPRVEATVTGVRNAFSGRGISYRFVKFKYAAPGAGGQGAVEHEHEVHVAPGVMATPKVGDRIPVRYDPSDPRRVNVEGNPGTAREWWSVATVLGVLWVIWVVMIAME